MFIWLPLVLWVYNDSVTAFQCHGGVEGVMTLDLCTRKYTVNKAE